MHTLTPNIPLVRFLASHRNESDFPEKGTDYYERFLQINGFLNSNVHPTVNQGATANNDGWLTDHGPDHIATVIRRASDLVMKTHDESLLTPYETFLLLLACHLHDVGNVFGRKQHERKIENVIAIIAQDLGRQTLGRDALEIRMVTNIAMAHGGYSPSDNNDKDTINHLRKQWPPSDKGIRMTLLASILRFADELADDYTRTSRFLLESGVIPTKSQVYHAYADRLREVRVRPADNSVQLRFELTTDDVNNKLGKGRRKVYLFDEIASRAVKMHHEHVYCSRFFAGHLHIDAIHVAINISSTFGTGMFVAPIDKIAFAMHQVGYPEKQCSLRDISPEVTVLNGKQLRQKIAKLEAK